MSVRQPKRIWIVTYLVTRPDERSTRDIQESHGLGRLAPFVKLGGLDITLDLHVSFCRTHVLAESDDVDLCFTETCRARGNEYWAAVKSSREKAYA